MNQDVRNVSHAHALKALRQTPNRVRLVVHRRKPLSDIYEVMPIELTREKRGLGLCLVSRHGDDGANSKRGRGVFVSELVPGGVADCDGRLTPGDQIVSVNGVDISGCSMEEAVARIKLAPLGAPLTLHVRRLKPYNPMSRLIGGGGPRTVRLMRDFATGTLGFSVVGGMGGPHGDLPVYVKTVFRGGAAHRQGTPIRHGDQILAVNGTSIEKMTHAEAVKVLNNCGNQVILQIL
jgi:C-terminal processing protease CtpA/Prc